MKKNALKFVTTVIVTLFALNISMAQPSGTGGGQGQGGPPPGSGPIDGGAVFFLVAAGGYAYRRLNKNKPEATAE